VCMCPKYLFNRLHQLLLAVAINSGMWGTLGIMTSFRHQSRRELLLIKREDASRLPYTIPCGLGGVLSFITCYEQKDLV
jgi:hypothetical protein